MLAALRQAAGPEARIRIDANEAWSLPEAVRLLNRWDEMFGIEYAEAPVAASPTHPDAGAAPARAGRPLRQ